MCQTSMFQLLFTVFDVLCFLCIAQFAYFAKAYLWIKAWFKSVHPEAILPSYELLCSYRLHLLMFYELWMLNSVMFWRWAEVLDLEREEQEA